MTLLFGLFAIFSSLGLLAYVLLNRRPSVAGDVPADLPASYDAWAPLPATAGSESAVRRMFVSLGRRVTGKNYATKAQQRLDRAGNPARWDAQRLLALKGAGLLGGVVLGLLFGTRWGGVWTLGVPAALGVAGLVFPDFWVKNIGEHRQEELTRGLPDAIDMMTVCVEAGLGFDSALARVARNLDGPFAEECARVLQEMQIGSSRTQALRALLDRSDVPELRSFVTAIVQSGELGISIGDVLREQSHQMRIKRRQRAEEKAQKLQVKLLFPLITCLLPSMFIVILGPAVLQIVGFFGKAGV
jgi:tight adherence protein C